MKKLFKTALVVALAAATLQGCTSYQYKEYQESAQKLSKRIDTEASSYKYRSVRDLKYPPITAKSYIEEEVIDWIHEPKNIVANGMPLSIVIDDITERKLQTEYDFDIDPNVIVSITHKGTKESALKMLALQADISIKMEQDAVYIRRYESKTFTLPVAAGVVNYQLGSQSGGSDSTNDEAITGSISSTGEGDGQFASLTGSNLNITQQVVEGVQAIIKQPDSEDLFGSVSHLDAMSSLVVRTTPSLMKQVETFIEKTVGEITKEVILEIEVIEWQLNEGSEFGVDASIAAALGSGGVNLELSSPTLGNAVDSGIGFSANTGRYSGTSGILKMLREHGEVAVTTSQVVKALNQKAQEVDLSDIRSYISKTSSTYDSDAAEPTVSIETDTVRDGVKMLVLPSVFEDEVFLRLNGTLSKFLYFENQQVSGVTVSSPRTRQSRFNVEGKYKYNKPFIVTHMKQVVEQSETANTAEVFHANMGERRVVNTLVLLTPRRMMEKN